MVPFGTSSTMLKLNLYASVGAQSPALYDGQKPPTPIEAPNEEEGSRPPSADSKKGILRPASRSSSREGRRSRSPSGKVMSLVYYFVYRFLLIG